MDLPTKVQRSQKERKPQMQKLIDILEMLFPRALPAKEEIAVRLKALRAQKQENHGAVEN